MLSCLTLIIPLLGLSRSIIINTTKTISIVIKIVGMYDLFNPRPLAYPIKEPFIIKIMNKRNNITSGTGRLRIAFRAPLSSISSFKEALKYPVVTGRGSIFAARVASSHIFKNIHIFTYVIHRDALFPQILIKNIFPLCLLNNVEQGSVHVFTQCASRGHGDAVVLSFENGRQHFYFTAKLCERQIK